MFFKLVDYATLSLEQSEEHWIWKKLAYLVNNNPQGLEKNSQSRPCVPAHSHFPPQQTRWDGAIEPPSACDPGKGLCPLASWAPTSAAAGEALHAARQFAATGTLGRLSLGKGALGVFLPSEGCLQT